METGIIISKEETGNVITATVALSDGREKQIFASLESVISCGDYDELASCELGTKINFLANYTGNLYGEEVTFVQVIA